MKKSGVKKLCIFAAAAMVLTGYLVWENNSLCLTEYEFSSPKVAAGLDGFKICHLSDIHNRRFGDKNRRLVGLAAEQQPDIIVVTGDLVDARHTDIPAALELIEQLVDIAPLYYITGNHEENLPTVAYNGLIESLYSLGVNMLDGRAEVISRGGEMLNIAGFFDKNDFPMRIAEGLVRDDMLNILINHRPQFAPEYAGAGFDVAFSGHAHGGQMRIPGVGGVIAPDQMFFPEYSEGMHRFGDRATVISRGVGNSLIPFRVNNRPEVVVLTLRSESE